ncbi:hypothetical protein [Kocuria sp. KH4]
MDTDSTAPVSTRLEDYALLSELHTGPLVFREGSIDRVCFPRFDSPAVFAALVDGAVVSRRYLPRTVVLSCPRIICSRPAQPPALAPSLSREPAGSRPYARLALDTVRVMF